MRVPDEVRDCTCYVQARWGQKHSLGTAFFVGVLLGVHEVREQDHVAVYVVTAQHCIMDEGKLPDELVLLVNNKSGATTPIKVDPKLWLRHPSSDCAVLPALFDLSNLDIMCYPADSAATETFIKERRIGPGDDAFLTGLLVHHPGRTRIMPIVRLGTIAALPDDPVLVSTGDGDHEDVVALMELHSIGGISGSPVYAHLPFWRDTEKGTIFVSQGAVAASGGEHYLLGVMHGFYPVRKNDPENISQGQENLNTGIAAVVRVDRILDLINAPAMVEMRAALKQRIQQQGMPTPTGTGSEFKNFEEALKAVLSVPKEHVEADIDREREERRRSN